MDLSKILSEALKWAPVIEIVSGMFGDPDEALREIRQWELSKRRANDERLDKLERGE
jgi:hypothetical protein